MQNNDDSGKNPHSFPAVPVPGPQKQLHPLFGTFCSSETFTEKSTGGKTYFTHLEAYLDDPIKKTWSVAKVVTTSHDSFYAFKRTSTTEVQTLKTKLSFKEAIEQLDAFERDCALQPALTRLYPDAPAMGFVHFKAFAEREGYVFDTAGKPHARPDRLALPPGHIFSEDDITRANNHLQRPADEFDNNGPASKLPASHFLLDKFTKAARQEDYATASAGLRVLGILDRFTDNVAQAEAKLQEYCKTYTELGKGDLIDEADSLFQMAAASLRQLKPYGVDTKEYESFILQCQISCHVLHAEGLFDLMNKGKGDFESNEAQFKARVQEALDAFKKIDHTDAGHKALQDMIVKTAAPEVPAAIGEFVRRYRQQREKYSPAKPAAAPKPPKP